MPRSYVKHLVSCICTHPLLKENSLDYAHQFRVFSEIDENGKFIPHLAKCNNCGNVHRVTEVGKNELYGKEDVDSLPNLDDFELELPERVIKLLKQYKCEIDVWQELAFILRNKYWELQEDKQCPVILFRDFDPNTRLLSGKILNVLGPDTFRIESFELEADEIVEL